MEDNSRFLYFGYGSNMSGDRLRLNSPSAEFCCIAKLEKYKLRFGYSKYGPSKLWHGAVASIVPDETDYVFGAVWSLSNENMVTLDRQEGVSLGIYRPFEVEVTTIEGKLIRCRVYELINPQLGNRPSPQYLDVILTGARQLKIPPEYLNRLEQIEHNGYSGEVHLQRQTEESAQNADVVNN
ncbi:uncharacterized protein TRIADDRAFT_20381 [Trichoplax adhaerens]|uniref:gamma-glutamylcyclotransferase n=1 Tax=Trichoplax adhaerens TaxID=10228 RepID=B3RJ36_TRIAD|nr:hypothetical protein TRIADDRAFT_20381 [Trichoplax adhaerens]EDV29053.1 hypothetical protein TRIADDRAFT_20381 [Trichoplax adhaerens]|eukprot:XP_002108255.1 hypothetical protein TRIADDRAFT_20381 [Trichoplax adhaerens]